MSFVVPASGRLAGQARPRTREPGVEVGQPLAVDEGLEDAADLVDLLGVLGRAQEAELTALPMWASIWSIRRASLLLAGRKTRTISTICVAGEHQPRVAALGVELGELLAQQREQQADVEGQRRRGTSRGSWALLVLVGALRRNA